MGSGGTRNDGVKALGSPTRAPSALADKGAAENAVAQQFVAAGRQLFFYSRRDDAASENTMEVDFLISKGYDNAAGRMRVSPVEVKSTKRYGTRSLEKFKAKFGGRVGMQYVLHPKPMSDEGDLVRLPLYMAHLL